MSQLKRNNPDGTYAPLPTMSKAEWAELQTAPMSDWARNIGRRQVTVNSEPRIIVRGQRKRLTKP